MKTRRLVLTAAVMIALALVLAVTTSKFVVQPSALTPLTQTPITSPTKLATSQSNNINLTCQPYSDSTDPTSLSLVSAKSGLTQQIDDPVSYRIYGQQAQDLERQIADCAPKTAGASQAEFTAETSYRLSWQYDFQTVGDGTCTLTNVKLGLHVGMVLPEWANPAGAQPAFVTQWQSFMVNLRTHENGHVTLDTQYAQSLLAQLQSLPATSCATITTVADGTVQTALAKLNQANDTYDATTNHGATQGAILP